MKYTYTDFVTHKPRYTRGEFLEWRRGGILNAWGAVFKTPRTYLFVPRYLLAPETIAQLPPIPKEAETASP